MEQKNVDGNYFNVEVFGDYFVSTAQGNVVKPFGPVQLKMRKWDSALSLSRFHILPRLISNVDTEFKSIRRCIVNRILTSDGNEVYGLPIKYMSKEQIETECKSQGYPLRSDMYVDIVELRGKLRKARENPDVFKRNEQKNINSFMRIDDALSLNEHIFDDIVKAKKEVRLSQGEVDLKQSPNPTQPPTTQVPVNEKLDTESLGATPTEFENEKKPDGKSKTHIKHLDETTGWPNGKKPSDDLHEKDGNKQDGDFEL